MSRLLTPLKDLQVLKHQIPAHGLTPNTSIQNKPLMIYKSAFVSSVSASDIESHLRSVGVVEPQWRYTMFSRSHFHTTSHELLAISHGSAALCFGHEENPKRIETMASKGDVVIVPAGVAHRLMKDMDDGFEMVGCYPVGCGWDMAYGKEGEEGRIEGIGSLGWFGRDPVYGGEGPILEV